MKTIIKNYIAAGITAAVLLGTTLAAKADLPTHSYTSLSTIKNISKIDVSGNVELVLVQGAEESVRVYNDYYASNALVQAKGGLLRISSFGKEKLTVVVHVKNLSSLSAEDQSSIKTYGNFKLLDLNIHLQDQAKADINAQAVKLRSQVSGQASLKLAGSAEDYSASLGDAAGLNLEGFVAGNSSLQTVKIPGCRLSHSSIQSDMANIDVPSH